MSLSFCRHWSWRRWRRRIHSLNIRVRFWIGIHNYLILGLGLLLVLARSLSLSSRALLGQRITERPVCDEAIPPGKQSSTVTFVLSGATNLRVSFPIRLHRVLLRALIAFPFLLPVFPAKMLLYPREIAESPRRIVVDAGRLRTDVNPLFHFLARSLPQLPW